MLPKLPKKTQDDEISSSCVCIYPSILCGRYTAFDLQKQQHQTEAQQDMTNPGHARDGCVYAGGKLGSQYLDHTPGHQHGDGQVQSNVINDQHPSGTCVGEGEVFSSTSSSRKTTMPSKK